METKIILLVVVGTAAVMLMAFTVVFFVFLYKRRVLENELKISALKSQHQQDMIAAALRSQEEERNRLGRELHDSVGATLSSVKMNIQVSIEKKSTQPLAPMLEFLNDTIQQVRKISHQMMPIVLKKYGLEKAIEDLFEKTANEQLSTHVAIAELINLSEEDQMLVYRIIQELMSNSLKHGHVSALKISGKRTPDCYVLEYADDGIGYPESVIKKSEGMGMYNILTRAQALNATVHFSNGQNGGAVTQLAINEVDD